jgi:hypothetical protein
MIMNTNRSLVLMLGLMVLTSCSKPTFTGHGHLQEVSGRDQHGPHALKSPFVIDGGIMTFILFSEFAGKPLDAAALVTVRQNTEGDYSYSGEANSGKDDLVWLQRFGTRSPQDAEFRYEIEFEPLRERVYVTEKEYELAAGRIFLIDCTTEPTKVEQLGADLNTIAADLAPDPESVRVALKTLRDSEKQVRDFLGPK